MGLTQTEIFIFVAEQQNTVFWVSSALTSTTPKTLPGRCMLGSQFAPTAAPQTCCTCPSWKKMVHVTGQFSCILQSHECPHFWGDWAASWWELTYHKFLYLRPKLQHRKYILHGKLHCGRGCGERGNRNSWRHCYAMQKYYFTLKRAKATYFDLPQHTQLKHFVSVKINMLKKCQLCIRICILKSF